MAGMRDSRTNAEPHPYTVDVILHGAEPYPCVICGKQRQEHDAPRDDLVTRLDALYETHRSNGYLKGSASDIADHWPEMRERLTAAEAERDEWRQAAQYENAEKLRMRDEGNARVIAAEARADRAQDAALEAGRQRQDALDSKRWVEAERDEAVELLRDAEAMLFNYDSGYDPAPWREQLEAFLAREGNG